MLDKILLKKNNLILIFTLAYLAAFTVNSLFQANLEFLYYTVLMVGLIFIVLKINRFLHLAFFVVFNLSILGFLHLLGGTWYLGTTRLYDVYFIPGLIRYDNIIHTYATFIATIALYSLLSNAIYIKVRKRYWAFALILILMAIGLGTINELVELLAVVLFNVQEKVGGYFNNALDLLFNTIGATLATVVIYYYLERPKFMKRLKLDNISQDKIE